MNMFDIFCGKYSVCFIGDERHYNRQRDKLNNRNVKSLTVSGSTLIMKFCRVFLSPNTNIFHLTIHHYFHIVTIGIINTHVTIKHSLICK